MPFITARRILAFTGRVADFREYLRQQREAELAYQARRRQGVA